MFSILKRGNKGVFFLIVLFFLHGIHAIASMPSRSCDQNPALPGVRVEVSHQANSIQLSYEVPPLLATRNQDMLFRGEPTTRLWFNGCITLQNEGEPVFPVIPSQVIIPPGVKIKSIQFEGGTLVPLDGYHIVEYGPAFHPISMPELAREATINTEIYESTQPLPYTHTELVTVQYQNGIAIAYVNIYPIVFNPTARSLAYYKDLRITINTTPDPSAYSDCRVDYSAFNNSSPKVENPEDVSRYTNGSLHGSPYRGMCTSDEEFSLVIISNKSIIDNTKNPSIEEYVKHKESRGWKVKVVDIAEVYRTYPASNNSDKLRKFIKTAYNNWKTKAVFLLGDINVIPLRTVFDKAQASYQDSLPSDIPYQCLDGDSWNNDYKAELIIGRGVAENEKEAANLLRKILAHENAPATSPHFKNVLMVGEDLGKDFNPQYAEPVLQQLIDGVTSKKTKGFKELKDFKVDGLHDSKSKTWQATECLTKINSNTYGLYHHYGHCQYNYLMKMTHKEDPHKSAKLTIDPPKDLTNTNYSFIYSYGCIPGAFDKKCMAEAMTTTGPNGCWGVVLNSRFGWGGSMEAPSHMYGRKFWDAFCGKGKTFIGECNQYAHEENISTITQPCMRWVFLESNTLTDPTVPIRGANESTEIINGTNKTTVPLNKKLSACKFSKGFLFQAPLQKGAYELSLYDTRGRLLEVLSKGTMQATGIQHFVWNTDRGHSLLPASGIIIVKLKTGSLTQTHRLTNF